MIVVTLENMSFGISEKFRMFNIKDKDIHYSEDNYRCIYQHKPKDNKILFLELDADFHRPVPSSIHNDHHAMRDTGIFYVPTDT